MQSLAGVANKVSAKSFQLDEPDQDRWLLSYADLVTLLFAVFAYQTFQLSRQLELSRRPLATPPVVVSEQKTTKSLGRAWSEDLLARLSQKVNPNSTEIKLMADSRGVVVILSDSPVLFEVASSRLNASGIDLLRKLIPVALEGSPQLMIVGHADSSPIRDSLYRDNFDLSLERAQSVWRTLIDLGVPAKNVQIVGLGSTLPVADNGTAEGRRKNRRVEIVFRYPESKSVADRQGQ